MKNKFLLFTWLLAVPLLWGGCSWLGSDDDELNIEPIDWDAEETLPEITTTGENTFGCLVNGEVWRPRGGPYFGLGAQLSYSYHEPTGGFGLIATRKLKSEDGQDSLYQDMSLSFSAQKVSALDSIQRATFWDPDLCDLSDMDNLSLDENFPFLFEVTYLNTTENIISGTFSFVATKEDCQDTIHVTDGRFDIKYAN